MKRESVCISLNTSYTSEEYGVIVSYRGASLTGSHDIIIGSDDCDNCNVQLEVGECKLYPIPSKGIVVKIRLESYTFRQKVDSQIGCSISLASHIYRIGCGIFGEDRDNARFSEEELSRLHMRIEELETKMQNSFGCIDEEMSSQFEQLHEKLDDVLRQARHMGRKDWSFFAMSSIVTILSSAGFAPDVSKKVFKATCEALSPFVDTFSSFLTNATDGVGVLPQ